MDNELSLHMGEFIFLVYFMYSLAYAVSVHTAVLAGSMLSIMVMLVTLYQYKLRIFCVVLFCTN